MNLVQTIIAGQAIKCIGTLDFANTHALPLISLGPRAMHLTYPFQARRNSEHRKFSTQLTEVMVHNLLSRAPHSI